MMKRIKATSWLVVFYINFLFDFFWNVSEWETLKYEKYGWASEGYGSMKLWLQIVWGINWGRKAMGTGKRIIEGK
jgi:hypothetical protein